ncbi:MAG: hypothetical protein MK212_07375 [Saprospiraceae bacterium]|nr:hypothetical protein [Saprospiraceae bacterium]
MKAEQYNIAFKIFETGNRKIPYAVSGKDLSGNSMNIELAGFISVNGIAYTREIINEVKSMSFNSFSTNNFIHEIPSYSSEYEVEFFANPNRTSFWNGVDYSDIPLQDFLDILQEWIEFLESLDFSHYLSNR